MLSIKELKRVYIEEFEKTIFFNESMKKNGFIISSQQNFDEERTTTIITVNHLNKIKDIEIDAAIYQLYDGPFLVPIQEYQIIKTIFDLYNKNSPVEFLDIIHEMSVSFMSASMQHKYENSQDILDSIKELFDESYEDDMI